LKKYVIYAGALINQAFLFQNQIEEYINKKMKIKLKILCAKNIPVHGGVKLNLIL